MSNGTSEKNLSTFLSTIEFRRAYPAENRVGRELEDEVAIKSDKAKTQVSLTVGRDEGWGWGRGRGARLQLVVELELVRTAARAALPSHARFVFRHFRLRSFLRPACWLPFSLSPPPPFKPTSLPPPPLPQQPISGLI